MVLPQKGDYVWIENKSQKDSVAIGGRIKDINKDQITVIDDEDKEYVLQVGTKLRHMHVSSIQGVDDMILLGDLNEAGILRNLHTRYKRGEIYTYTGNILVAVNPYEELAIYGAREVELYRNKRDNESLRPHIFSVASSTYRSGGSASQTIIVSGESGAGKTESTKLMLQQLAAESGQHSWIEQQIVDCNPILEAFGNAKTIRNDNSSRFGKFVDVEFGYGGQGGGVGRPGGGGSICCGEIDTFLLEKSRIVTQTACERNYHVFYTLFDGLADSDKKLWGLHGSSDGFHYLNQGGVIDTSTCTDIVDFTTLRSAMKVLLFTDGECREIFSLLASFLHLGNVQFAVAEQHHNTDTCKASADISFEFCCKLLQVNPDQLQKAMTTKSIITKDDLVVTNVGVEQAVNIRDAFVKGCYGRLFLWIVEKINGAIERKPNEQIKAAKGGPNSSKERKCIGILDIFGFENFEKNSFEQLCINYANESLQQFFVQHVFKLEQAEYADEGVDWQNVQFTDNQETLDLLAGKQCNILALVDEESGFPRGTDETLLSKLITSCAKHPLFIKQKSDIKQIFGIQHFAGPVHYHVEGFLEKNRDTFNADLVDLVRTSKNGFLKKLFEKDLKMGYETRKKSPSLIIQFRRSLERLMRVLVERQPHFVRCIKPNEFKQPHQFDRMLCLRQLRYSGMMETIRIRRAGYPIRHRFADFIDRYRVLVPGTKSSIECKDNREVTKLMCRAILDPQLYQVGKSKLFLKEAGDVYLEESRDDKLTKSVILLQKMWRGRLCRKNYKNKRDKAILLQRNIRRYQLRSRFLKLRRGISLLQATFRARLASRKLKNLRGFMKNVQRYCKGKLARMNVSRKRSAVVIMQSVVRGGLARFHVRQMKVENKKISDAMDLKVKEESLLTNEMDANKAKLEAEKRHKARMEEIWNENEASADQNREETRQKKQKIEDAQKRQKQPVDESEMVDEIFGSFDESVHGSMRSRAGPKAFEDLEHSQNKERIRVDKEVRYPYADIIIPGSLAADARDYPFSKFVATYFQSGNDIEMVRRPLSRPLLYHPLPGDSTAALAVWIIILRFTRDLPDPIMPSSRDSKNSSSVMNRIYQSLGRRFEPSQLQAIANSGETLTGKPSPYDIPGSGTRKNIVSLTLKKKSKFTEEVVAQLRNNDSGGDSKSGMTNHDELVRHLLDDRPPITSLEKLHFIIGHGILRPQLRDEIYCQLIKQQQMTNTNSTARGLVLLALCLGCFAPSEKLVRPLRGIFHTRFSSQLAQYLAIRLQRTLSNGTRNQPPAWVELRAVKKRLTSIELTVTCMDGRSHSIYADSASTSYEICTSLANKLGLRDYFGYSLFIAILDKVSSLGSGGDHVMDAVSQCEQFAQERGVAESRAQWRLFYRKEIFSPWHDVNEIRDDISTNLIYHQVCRGIKYGEYRCDSENELAKLVVYQSLIDRGNEPIIDQVNKYIPAFAIGTTKEKRNFWAKLLTKIEKEMSTSLANQPIEKLQQEVVRFARIKWPMLFSRFYEAVKFSGPSLETNDVIITVNWTGLYLVDSSERIHLELPFPEIVAVSSSRTSRLHGQTLSLTTMKGDTYTFNSANAEDIRDLVVLFLEGLKQRSKYVVAMESFSKPDPSFLVCKKGDLIVLADEFIGNETKSGSDWWFGENQRTKCRGDFPGDLVYILPTLEPPSTSILALFTDRSNSNDDHSNKSEKQRFQHTLEEYAKSNFRSSTDPPPHSPLWSHSAQTLRAPLLRRLLSREDIARLAGDTCFISILRYMGDHPCPRDLTSSDLAELIFEPCLKYESLKDEIYCQLVKQVTRNPNQQSEKSGWELIWLATGIMSPSSTLYRELMEVLRTSKSSLANDCLSRLQRTMKSGQRRYPPHPIEINAVQMGKIIHHKIYFPNDSSEAFEITSTTKCKDLCNNICTRLGIKETKGLGLFVKSADKAISMPEGDFFFDFLRQLSDWVLRHRPARDGKLDFSYQVFFMRKLWSTTVPGHDKVADLALHYPQEVRKFLYGYHKVTVTDGTILGGLILRANCNNDSNAVQTSLQQLDTLVPPDILTKVPANELKQKIHNQYQNNSGITGEDAKIRLLKYMFPWPTFGSAFFEVKQSTNPNVPEKILMAINKNGVYLIHTKTKEILDHYPYSSISNWSSGNTYFNMTIGNLIHGRKLLCETPLGYKMDDLLTSYISLMLTSIGA